MKGRSLLLLRASLGLLVLLGVWKSAVDPWGWYLAGADVLFHPSLIVFAASLVLWGFGNEDRLVVGGRRGATVRDGR